MTNRIITIGRQYGSGGKEIGEKVAKALGIACYDRALLELASRKLGVNVTDLEKIDEKARGRLLSVCQIPNDVPDDKIGYELPINDHMFQVQANIIMELAEKNSCVMIGRCADFVLHDYPRCISVFICADEEDRIRRIRASYQMSEKAALTAMKHVDKRRRYYYETYTKWDWGGQDTYQVIINASSLGIDRSVSVIRGMYMDI